MNDDKGDRETGERPAGPAGGQAMSPAWREFYEAVREAIRSTARP